MIDWLVLVIGAALGFFAGVFAGEAHVQREVLIEMIDELMWGEDGREDEEERKR